MLLAWPALLDSPIVEFIEPYRLVQMWISLDSILLFCLLGAQYRQERTTAEEAHHAAIESLRRSHDSERAKRSFINNVGHELRGPVQAIKHFSESLKPELPSSLRPRLDQIDSNLGSVSGMLDALLSYAETGNSSRRREMKRFALAPLLGQLRDEFSPAVASKGLELRFHMTDEEVFSDKVLLSRVLRNLIDNAVKYTSAGFVEVRVADLGERVLVTVDDSGIGIPRDQLSGVFEEFVQIDNADCTEGVGLGLSIVRELTATLGIELQLSSVHGEGTRFELIIPKDPAHTGAALSAEDERKDSVSAPALEGLRILVVSRSDAETSVIRDRLVAWGCDVRFLTSAEAVSSIEQGVVSMQPDAIVIHSEDYALLAPSMPDLLAAFPVLVFGEDLTDRPSLSINTELHIFLPDTPKPMALRSFLQRRVASARRAS